MFVIQGVWFYFLDQSVNKSSSAPAPSTRTTKITEDVPLPPREENSDEEMEELDYDVIAKSMKDSYEKQQEKQKQSQSKYMVARHAKNLGVPPSSSGLGKSILDWIKSMLFMDSTHTKLPDPPTSAEK